MAAPQPQGGKQGSILPILLFAGVVYVLFFFFMQRNRNRKVTDMRNALVPGQRVMTVAGLYATVSAVEEGDVIVLEVAPGVESRYSKRAIGQVLGGEESADQDGGEDSGADGDEDRPSGT